MMAKVDETLRLMKDLGEVLRRENSALARHRITELKDLAPVKTKLADEYAKKFKGFPATRRCCRASTRTGRTRWSGRPRS